MKKRYDAGDQYSQCIGVPGCGLQRGPRVVEGCILVSLRMLRKTPILLAMGSGLCVKNFKKRSREKHSMTTSSL